MRARARARARVRARVSRVTRASSLMRPGMVGDLDIRLGT